MFQPKTSKFGTNLVLGWTKFFLVITKNQIPTKKVSKLGYGSSSGHIVINNNLNGCECGKERLDEEIIERIVNMTIDKMHERMKAEKQKKKEKKQKYNINI